MLRASCSGCVITGRQSPILKLGFLLQAMQKKPDGLPDPNKREGPVATAKDIYEEGGLPVSSDIMQESHLCRLLSPPLHSRHRTSKHCLLVTTCKCKPGMVSVACSVSTDATHPGNTTKGINLLIMWLQALWRGCMPALIMVSNPTVQYVIYEWLVARLAEWRKSAAATGELGSYLMTCLCISADQSRTGSTAPIQELSNSLHIRQHYLFNLATI